MKTFIALLVVAVIGFGAWALWNANNSTYVSLNASASPTAYVYPTDTPLDNAYVSATPTATAIPYTAPTRTPARTPTPTPPGLGGQGTLPPRAPVFITLNTMNGSGESGVAAITASSNDLATINFNLAGWTPGTSQNAYIFSGSCSALGGIRYGLNPVTNGSGMTILNANFLDIAQSPNNFSIVVYGPGSQANTEYACGQLR